jgi:hypothetical protein
MTENLSGPASQIEQRLSTLEGSLRRQRRLSWGLGAALLAVLSVAAADKLGEVSGSSFRLVDKQGRVRATLAGDEAGNPTLTFLTPEGVATRAIGQHDDVPARVAELERVIGSIQRVQVLGGSPTLVDPGPVTGGRLDELERETDRQRRELAEQQRQAAQAQDRMRMEQDLRRREQERQDLQRRIDEASRKP